MHLWIYPTTPSPKLHPQKEMYFFFFYQMASLLSLTKVKDCVRIQYSLVFVFGPEAFPL